MRQTWADKLRGFEAAARVDAQQRRAAGPPSPAEALDAAFDLWRLNPKLFGTTSAIDEREERAARAAWIRLRRAWRG